MMSIASFVFAAVAVMAIDGPGAAPQGASQGDYSRPMMDECGGGDTTPGVRPRDAMAHLLVQLGTERSQSFRNLLDDLRRSKMIVYVQVQQDPVGTIAGSLRFIGAEGCVRSVLATVESGTTSLGSAQRNVVPLTAILGHELQHAREVADEPSIRSVAAFDSHFRTVGIHVGSNAVDTEAARRIGDLVERELRGLVKQPGLAMNATGEGDAQ